MSGRDIFLERIRMLQESWVCENCGADMPGDLINCLNCQEFRSPGGIVDDEEI